jgi:uncharacterized membrane protein
MDNNFFYWITILCIWYLSTLVLSVASLPIGATIFSKFKDKGYPFFRIITIGVVGYVLFLLSSLKVLSFTQLSVVSLLFLWLFVNYVIKKKLKPELPRIKTILIYEFWFVVLLALWTYLKGIDPTIRSLEKYMDFGFINSILNSQFLPPQDPWFASTQNNFFSVNYYYFGHFITAFIIKLNSISPSVSYNLMLTTIFASSMTMTFSLGYNIYIYLVNTFAHAKSKLLWFKPVLAGVLSAILTNLGGNLHTIYLFTKGYHAEQPIPFWKILSSFNLKDYWYPNATRFIPFTIHEFPSYSYVVSDLHGHVLDIIFVLTLIACFLVFIVNQNKITDRTILILTSLFLSITYMTNSTDFLIYGSLFFFILVIKYENVSKILFTYALTILSALFLTLPFSVNFKPFASSLGLNCAPDFLTSSNKLGPFVFESGKCQTSPFWMLFILWGFFWLNFIAFLVFIFFQKKKFPNTKHKIFYFIFFLFVESVLLTLFAEFFYFKDIYPAHFRANTMFKLGYQAFIMMSILSGVVITFVIASHKRINIKRLFYSLLVFPSLFFILLYPFLSVPSYFNGSFKTLDGSAWIKNSYPDISEIIRIINGKKQSDEKAFTILEAHGNSYTDYNLISAHTGIATVIGWPVHEWLWRGTIDLVNKRAEEVRFVYESPKSELKKIKTILNKYNIRYIVISNLEKDKYASLKINKFYKIGKPIYQNNDNYLFEYNDKENIF